MRTYRAAWSLALAGLVLVGVTFACSPSEGDHCQRNEDCSGTLTCSLSKQICESPTGGDDDDELPDAVIPPPPPDLPDIEPEDASLDAMSDAADDASEDATPDAE